MQPFLPSLLWPQLIAQSGTHPVQSLSWANWIISPEILKTGHRKTLVSPFEACGFELPLWARRKGGEETGLWTEHNAYMPRQYVERMKVVPPCWDGALLHLFCVAAGILCS